MNPRLVCCVLLVLTACAEVKVPAGPPPPPGPDNPAWLASYLPSAILVLKSENDPVIVKKFEDALARIKQTKAVRLDDFPRGQTAPTVQSREIRARPLKTGDAGFVVLVSQTGHVVALYQAYTTDQRWAHAVAESIASTTYTPARLDGHPVPILIYERNRVYHQYYND